MGAGSNPSQSRLSRLVFFFSSRRRHTRWPRDWSSDVCSSDLIGANQGVQFPIAQAYAHLEAADLMRFKAAWLFDSKKSHGAEANMAKLLASQASRSEERRVGKECRARRAGDSEKGKQGQGWMS